jgi:AcrR family transcriptional regulator
MPTSANTATRTREAILLTALQLYAEQGLQGASLRTISARSGSRNSAAAHYHFGSRLGVIEAIIGHIIGHLRPRFEPAISAVEAMPQPGPRDVLQAVFLPYLALTREPAWGPWALRFMAHLHTDNTPEIAAIVNRRFRLDLERIERQLQRALPRVPPDILRLRLTFSMTNLIHGTAEIELLRNTPFGDIRPDNTKLFHYFLDFVEGALSFEAPS